MGFRTNDKKNLKGYVFSSLVPAFSQFFTQKRFWFLLVLGV